MSEFLGILAPAYDSIRDSDDKEPLAVSADTFRTVAFSRSDRLQGVPEFDPGLSSTFVP